MEVDLIFRIAAIGIIVSVLYQVLLSGGTSDADFTCRIDRGPYHAYI